MRIDIYNRSTQAKGSFNSGEIIENKPLGFPQDGGELKPYSNIFYWANAEANTDSEIGLHPHRGFEIMSVVLEGEIEHFDNQAERWIPLKAGDVQLIRAGKGIKHAELMKRNSRMFQIWFDPGLQRTLSKEPIYKDYRSNEFKKEESQAYTVRILKNNEGPIIMDTEGIIILDYSLRGGKHHFDLHKDSVYSLYNIRGHMKINGNEFEEDAFAIIQDHSVMDIELKEEGRVFIIESPIKPRYQTYFELSGW